MDDQRAAELRMARLTYGDVGATRANLPSSGYRILRKSVQLPDTLGFDLARRDLLGWQVQSRAGIGVTASGNVAADVVVDLRIGVRRIALRAPCRVVYVIDEPDRCGFAYGTLPGHPESGEESFVLHRSPTGSVTFAVTAFSRPASPLSRLAGPIGHGIQDWMTARYLQAFV
jgi:uncharacterized protein (UPF0548 family)